MLTKSNKQMSGFSVLTTDDLFTVNGGGDYNKIDFTIKKEPTITDVVSKIIPLPNNISFSNGGITYSTKSFSVTLSADSLSASISFGFKF